MKVDYSSFVSTVSENTLGTYHIPYELEGFVSAGGLGRLGSLLSLQSATRKQKPNGTARRTCSCGCKNNDDVLIVIYAVYRLLALVEPHRMSDCEHTLKLDVPIMC